MAEQPEQERPRQEPPGLAPGASFACGPPGVWKGWTFNLAGTGGDESALGGTHQGERGDVVFRFLVSPGTLRECLHRVQHVRAKLVRTLGIGGADAFPEPLQ